MMIGAVVSRTCDAGFEHESRDCFVHAIRFVTGVPYRDAHEFVRTHFGRVDGKSTMGVDSGLQRIDQLKQYIFGFRVFTQKTMVSTRLRRTRWGAYRQVGVYRTAAQFAARFPRGKFLLCSNNHAFACIDGQIYDNGYAGARTNVTYAWEFIESSRVG
jgi:hypothetical protein